MQSVVVKSVGFLRTARFKPALTEYHKSINHTRKTALMNKSSSEGYQAEMGKLPITSMRMQFVLHDDDRRRYVIASIHQKNASTTVQIDL